MGKPAKIQKKYKWEAVPCDEVPNVYRVNHVKRLFSVAQNRAFEGQLPKLRYYHHIKKVDPEEVNNNKVVSVKTQPITASSKKNGSAGQMKITGELLFVLITFPTDEPSSLSDFLKEKKRLAVTTKKK